MYDESYENYSHPANLAPDYSGPVAFGTHVDGAVNDGTEYLVSRPSSESVWRFVWRRICEDFRMLTVFPRYLERRFWFRRRWKQK